MLDFQLAIPKLLQVGGDGGVELCGLGQLLAKRGGKARHLFHEGFTVVLEGFGSDIMAGREHVAVLADFIELGCFVKARYVGVLSSAFIFAPIMAGSGDFGYVLVG